MIDPGLNLIRKYLVHDRDGKHIIPVWDAPKVLGRRTMVSFRRKFCPSCVSNLEEQQKKSPNRPKMVKQSMQSVGGVVSTPVCEEKQFPMNIVGLWDFGR